MRYSRPQSLDELLRHLCSVSGDVCVLLAGGTDLMPRYEQGMSMPEELVDVKHVAELSGITLHGDHFEIGALTTIEEIKRSEEIRSRTLSLAEAGDEFAAVQIRHRATIGGNIVNASPAGDLIPPLVAMDAQLNIVSRTEQRSVPIQEFTLGPGKTALKPGEILKSITVPISGADSRFVKLGLRKAMAISVVNFAIVYKATSSGFESLRIAAGAVAPTVVTLDAFTNAVLDDPKAIDRGIDLVDKSIAPIDDLRASAMYRRKALKNLLKHTLHQVLEDSSE
ncbi:MAG: FAD binding domain-containing protein [bacterium]